MQNMNSRRLGWILCFLFAILAVRAQYTVTGGQGAPYLFDDSGNRVHVYLVNGADNVTISYTSSSSSGHQWYRFKAKALDREPVVSEQNGTSSVIRNVEEGYGYYVEVPNDPATGVYGWFVWIIDYSKYAFNPQGLTVKYGDCSVVRLAVSPAAPEIAYRVPTSGAEKKLEREFEVSYQTLEWQGESMQFNPVTKHVVIKGASTENLNPSLPAPFCDTAFKLSGDQFARHFNAAKTVSTENYPAVALEVHADTTLIFEDSPTLMSEDGKLSAPVEIHFSAYANEPVASLFIWKIYKKEEPENLLLRFSGQEVDYVFRDAGDYVAELEVANRSNDCTATGGPFEISIMDSFLDVPNAFSPGTTPGINDEFRPVYKSIVDYKCWIFNRWGVEMYHSTNPAQGWDGKKGGKYVPPGVYFYVIDAKGSDGVKHNKKGSINILRPKTIDDQIIEQ